ncbi:uncharacterized protein [Macrobrachium rosenbergii]|uniref:uncharacterized protein n=1 Tax=Macrobrachium rosenbergii TaxID=79674 RepID=UPI0034D63304
MLVAVTVIMLFANQHTLGHATNLSHLLTYNNPVPDETLHIRESGRRTTPRTAKTLSTLRLTESHPVPTQTPYSTSLTSEDALPRTNSMDQVGKDCLKLSYNNTEHTYKSGTYVYDIWFKSLSAEATIQLGFDFSASGLKLSGPKKYRYFITSERWHRLQVFRSDTLDDCTSAKVRITGVVDECLPHSTPSLLRVSSGDDRSLVIWSNCNAQGPWWDEVTKVQPLVQTSTGLYMWLCLGLLIILIPLTIYACCLQYQLIKERSAESRKESIYAEWNYSRPTSATCISKDSEKCTVQTSLASI